VVWLIEGESTVTEVVVKLVMVVLGSGVDVEYCWALVEADSKGVYISSTTVVRPYWWPGARMTFIQ
jgi:hypothetical protein